MNQPTTDDALGRCVAKMRAADVDPVAIDVFAHYHRLCRAGATGIIPEDSISPLLDPPTLDSVVVSEAEASAALAQTVVI